MSKPGALPLIAALIGFLIHFGNVAAGIGIFPGDVAEMLMLHSC